MMNTNTSAFKKWQSKDRELHSLETLIFHAAREPDPRPAEMSARELEERARALREEVERLFPSAMEELEESVRTLKEKRPRLQDH